MPGDAEYLTTAELAKRWHMHVNTLKTWRRTNKGPPYIQPSGPGGKALYKLAEIEAWEVATSSAARNKHS